MIKGIEVGQGWYITQVGTLGGLVQLHVHPNEDVNEHVLTAECWCKPVFHERINNSQMVTHNSADRREVIEAAAKFSKS